MRQQKTLLVMGAALGCMVTFAACSEETADPIVTVVPPSCAANTVECADASLALVCPPDGSGWVSFPCAGGCDNGTCTTETCTPNAAECVNDALAQVCPADGSGWTAVACSEGETCAAGACTVDPPADLCTAGDTECAGADVVRTCNAEGDGWFYLACDDGYVCNAGACEIDTDALCWPGDGFCSDATTAWVCADSGEGFVETPCPTGTDCIQGLCVGNNCIVGEQQCRDGGWAVAECTDGEQWVETLCAATESCFEMSDGMSAECVEMTCPLWEQACGNPDDANVDDTLFYSVCEPNMNGGVSWVSYECDVPLECDPALLNGYYDSPCNAECLPGTERCNGNSRQVCNVDGTWGALTACDDDPARQCLVKPGSMTTDGLSDALCADPLCAYVFVEAGEAVADMQLGVCDDGQIRLCSLDTGLLAATATACTTGICVSDPNTIVDGKNPGMCVEECVTGAERCLSPGMGPVYQSCVNGAWSAAYQACATDTCWNTVENGLPSTVCAECVTDAKRCDGDQIETCVAGDWAAPVDCTLGVCQPMGATAACVAECTPGATYCEGSTVIASDGSSTGYDSELACGTDGMYGASTLCTGTETCRISSTGQQLGCVECVDADDGGNDLTIADSRCSGGATSLQVCTNNAWPQATACGTGRHCEVIEPPPVCGSCYGINPCTESNIIAYGYPGGCAELNYPGDDYQPIQCGVTPDCCHEPYWDEFCYPPSLQGSRASACVDDPT